MIDLISQQEKSPQTHVKLQHLHTQKWYSWIPLTIHGPRSIFLSGEVEGRHAGMQARLVKKRESSSNDLLCLELVVTQERGEWPILNCWMPLQYHEYMLGTFYSMVQIYSDGRLIEKFPVDVLNA